MGDQSVNVMDVCREGEGEGDLAMWRRSTRSQRVRSEGQGSEEGMVGKGGEGALLILGVKDLSGMDRGITDQVEGLALKREGEEKSEE